MRAIVNFQAVDGPFGGANSFMRSLIRELNRLGVECVNDLQAQADVALLNSLTQRLSLESVMRLHDRGVPVVHRKTGFMVSGSPEERAVHDGCVEGDRRQIAFSPYIAHSVFQSRYSLDLFTREGFSGPATIIPNGVDAARFHPYERRRIVRRRLRSFWDGRQIFKIVIVTWSVDDRKGFPEYRKIDRVLAGNGDVEVTLIGRAPDDAAFEKIRVRGAVSHDQLASLLREQHVMLNLSEHETCSNAVAEALNCGLPVIYHPSGASPEMVGAAGVPYDGDIRSCLDAVRSRYGDMTVAAMGNPFQIQRAARQYCRLLEETASS